MRIGQVLGQAMQQAARAMQQAAKASAAFNQSVAKAKAQPVVKDIVAGKSIEVIARAQGVAPAVVIKQLEEAGYDVTPTNPSSDVGKTEIRDAETGQVVATEYYDFQHDSYYIEVSAPGGGPASTPVRDGQGRKVTTSRDPNTGAITTRYEDDLGSGSVIESTQLPDGTKVEKTTTKDGPVTEKTTLPNGVSTEKTTYKNGRTQTVVTTPDGKKTDLASDQDTTPAGVQPIITDFGNGKSIDQIAHDRGWTREQVVAQLAAAGFEVKNPKDEAGVENDGDTVESASIVEQTSGEVVAIQSQKLTDAAANTDAAGREANQAINDYNAKALDHQEAWAQKNQNRYATKDEAFAAWEADWNASPEGQEAKRILLPYLNAYYSASQNELRLTSIAAGGDPQTSNAAVSHRAGDIKARNGNSPEAPKLNNIVDMGAQQVLSESPQMREAAVNVRNAITDKNEAEATLNEVNDRHNQPGPQNKEDRQAQAAEVKAAEDAVTKAELNVNQALNIELAISIVDQQEAAAKAEAKSVSPGLFDQQRDDILSGKIDLTDFDDAQVDIAVEGVILRHPELENEQNFPLVLGVIAQGEALKHSDEIDAAMESLPEIRDDPKTPQWMKDLIDTDKVSAALIVALGVQNELPEPGNGEEKRLLEESPLLFAQLRYLGLHLERPKADPENPVTKDISGLAVDQINAEREKLAKSTNPEDTAKLDNLDLLTLASGYVRANYLVDEWEKTQEKETPQQAVSKMSGDGINENDYNNPDAALPTEVGKFINTLNVNMQAVSTLMPQQGMQIWDAVDGDVTAYVNEQAHFLNDAYNKADDSDRPTVIATIGEWQRQMGQFAPPELANVVIDATVDNFDPAIITKHGGPRVRDGLQILADRAGLDGAGALVDWMFASDANIQLRDFLTLQRDGTGETLGVALLKGLDARGTNKPFLKELQDVFEADVQWVEQQNANTPARKNFDLFNVDRNSRLTEIFDNLLKNKGDILTKPLKFGTDPTSDNEYGKKLGLTPDRPNAPDDEARYTDPEKLAKIHDFKQIDWISRGANLPVDLNALAPLIASGKPLPDNENLHKIREFQSWIEEIGGENAELTIMPAVYASPRDDVFTIYLMRVVGDANHDGKITRDVTPQTDEYGNATGSLADEDMIIDASAGDLFLDGENLPTRFADFTAFQEENLLDADEGRLYLAGSRNGLLDDDNQDGQVDNINFEGVEAAITTTGEHIQIWGDRIMAVAGLLAGGALIIASGGLLAPGVILASSIYFGGRSIQTGAEMAEHGQSFDPINPRAKGAWLGFLDPVATSFWLESLASTTGAAALRPLVFGRSITGLRTATATRASETGLSRNLGTELFLRRGLQTNLYRSQLANGSKSIAAISGFSDGAETFFEGMDMAKAIKDGRINLLDWSEDSASWDLVLMGGGAASFALHHSVNAARNRGLLNQAENAATARANNGTTLQTAASIWPPSQEASSSPAIQVKSGVNDRAGSFDGSDLDTRTTMTRPPGAPKRTLFIGPSDADDLAEGVVFIPTDSTDILSDIRDGGLQDELFGRVVFKGPYTLLGDPAFLAGISSKLSGGALLQIETGKNAADERRQIEQNITNAGLRVVDVPAAGYQNAPKGIWSIQAIKPASWPEIHANLPRLRNLVNDVNQNDLLPAFQGYISETLQTRSIPDIRAYAVEENAWGTELKKAKISDPKTSAFVSFKDHVPTAVKFKLGSRRELPSREAVIHELLHWHVHPDFDGLAGSLRVTPKARGARSYDLHEGVADYLTFFLAGPDRFVNRPMGFGAFEVAGQNADPSKKWPGPRMERWEGYPDEVRATETVVDKMAVGHRRDGYDADQARARALDDLQRAFFLGDGEALRRFRDAALSVEGIVEQAPRAEGPRNSLRIGTPKEPDATGGPDPMSYVDRIVHLEPLNETNAAAVMPWIEGDLKNLSLEYHREGGADGMIRKWLDDIAEGTRFAYVIYPAAGSRLRREPLGIISLHKGRLIEESETSPGQYPPDWPVPPLALSPDAYKAAEMSDVLNDVRTNYPEALSRALLEVGPNDPVKLLKALSESEYIPEKRRPRPLKSAGDKSIKYLNDLGPVWQFSTYLIRPRTSGSSPLWPFVQGVVNKAAKMKIMAEVAQAEVLGGELIPVFYARVHAGGAFSVSFPDRAVQVFVDDNGDAHLISPDDTVQVTEFDDGARLQVWNDDATRWTSPDGEAKGLKNPEAIKSNPRSLAGQQSQTDSGPIVVVLEDRSPRESQVDRNVAIFETPRDRYLRIDEGGNIVLDGKGAKKWLRNIQEALNADAEKGHEWSSAPSPYSSLPKPIDLTKAKFIDTSGQDRTDFIYTSGKDRDSLPDGDYRLDAFPMGRDGLPTVQQLIDNFEQKKRGKDYSTKALGKEVFNALNGRTEKPLTNERKEKLPLTDQQRYDKEWKIYDRYLREREYLTSQELAERYGPDGLQPPRKPWRLEDKEPRWVHNKQKKLPWWLKDATRLDAKGKPLPLRECEVEVQPVKQAQVWDLRLSELSRVRIDGSAAPEPGIEAGPLPVGSQTIVSSSKGIGTKTSFGTLDTAIRLSVETKNLDPLKAAVNTQIGSTQRPDEFNQQTPYGWGASPILDWTIFTVFAGPLIKIAKNKFFGKPKNADETEDDGWVVKLRSASLVEEAPDSSSCKVKIDYYLQATAKPVTLEDGERDHFGNTAQEAPNGQVELRDRIPVDRVIRDRRFAVPVWLSRLIEAWLHFTTGIPLNDTLRLVFAIEVRQEVKLKDPPRKGDIVPREWIELFNAPSSGSTMTMEVTVRPSKDGTMPDLKAFLDNPTVEAIQEMARKGHIDPEEKADSDDDADVETYLPEGHNLHQTAVPGKDAYRTIDDADGNVIRDEDGNVIQRPDEATHNLWEVVNNQPLDSWLSRLIYKFVGTKSEDLSPDKTGRVSPPHNLPVGNAKNFWDMVFGQNHERANKGIRVTLSVGPNQLRANGVSVSTEVRPQANFKAPEIAPVVRDGEMAIYRLSPDSSNGVLVPLWFIDDISQALGGGAPIIPAGGTKQIETFLTALEAFPDQGELVAQFRQKFRSVKEPVISDSANLRRKDAQAITDLLPGLGQYIRRPADLNLLPQESLTVRGRVVEDVRELRVAASPHVFLVIADGSALPSLDEFVSYITSHPNYHPGKDVELYFCRAGTRNGPAPGEPDYISLAVQHDSLARQLGNRLGGRVHAIDGDIELGATTILHGSAVTERPDLPLYVAVDEKLEGEPANLPRDPKDRTLHLQGNANFDAQWRFWMEDGGRGVPVEGEFNPTAMGQGAWVGNHPVDSVHLGRGNGPQMPSAAESTDALLQQGWADPRVRNATDYRPIYDHYIRRNQPQTWGSDLPGHETVGRYVQRLSETSQNRPKGFDDIKVSPDFLSFNRPNRYPATQRIFINVNLNRAGELADFIAREIVYKPNEYPGVRMAKVPGPSQWAKQRSDSAVIYIDTPENRQRVLDALIAYHRQYPHHFMPEVPPMTEPVLPGISLADHPTHEMMGRANHILGYPASHRLSFGSLRSEAIRLAIGDTIAAHGPSLDARTLGALRANVRQRFVQFGIDPDNPSRNLPQQPGEAAVWRPSTNDIMLVVWSGDASRRPALGEVFFNYPDFGRTPIPDGHFESVYFENVSLDALAETAPLAISKIYRSLEPGGDARITTESRAVSEWDGLLIDEYAQHLEDAGFEDVEVFERDAGETRFFQFYAVKPASGAPSGPPGGGKPVVPGPQDPTRTSGDADAAHEWSAPEDPTEPRAFSLLDDEAFSLFDDEHVRDLTRRRLGLNAFVANNALYSPSMRSEIPIVTVSMADAEHFSAFGRSLTPHEFLLSEDTYLEWLGGWASDGPGSPLVLDISNPSVAATALAQRLSNISGAEIIAPGAEAPTQWQILRPTHTAQEQQVGRIEVSENGDVVLVRGAERRVIEPHELHQHLGQLLGAGGSKTAFQLYDKVLVVYRKVTDPRADRRAAQIKATQWLLDQDAPFVARILGTSEVYGLDAIIMDLSRSHNYSIEKAYATPSDRQYYDVRNVSLINESSLSSLREMRDFYVNRNIGVDDQQFLIAEGGTFLLHDFSIVYDFREGIAYDFSTGTEYDLSGNEYEYQYGDTLPQSNHGFIREIDHWIELAETVISRRRNI